MIKLGYMHLQIGGPEIMKASIYFSNNNNSTSNMRQCTKRNKRTNNLSGNRTIYSSQSSLLLSFVQLKIISFLHSPLHRDLVVLYTRRTEHPRPLPSQEQILPDLA
jgi:hypothetical protein